ncbi:8978_t:CDS:2, partial [Gigaspora rosea]
PDMTEEQRQIIMKRIHEVRSKYEAFVESKEETRLALSLCHDNEHEVL